MPYEKRPGSISLWSQRNKRNEKAPDWKPLKDRESGEEETLELVIGNQVVEFEVAGWTRRTAKGAEFISLSVKEKGRRPNRDINIAFDGPAEKGDEPPW